MNAGNFSARASTRKEADEIERQSENESAASQSGHDLWSAISDLGERRLAINALERAGSSGNGVSSTMTRMTGQLTTRQSGCFIELAARGLDFSFTDWEREITNYGNCNVEKDEENIRKRKASSVLHILCIRLSVYTLFLKQLYHEAIALRSVSLRNLLNESIYRRKFRSRLY